MWKFGRERSTGITSVIWTFFSLFLSFLQIKEMFGAGTACVVSPVNRILFEGQVRLDIHIIYVKSVKP